MKVVIMLMALVGFGGLAGAQEKLDLKVALEQGKVKAVFRGNDTGEKSELLNYGLYLGECIVASLKNMTKEPIIVVISPGFLLVPENDSVQTMVVTAEKEIFLGPLQVVHEKVSAMCTEIDDRAPLSKDKLTLHKNPNPGLRRLAREIDQKNGNNFTGQLAVWGYMNQVKEEKLLMYHSHEDTLKAARALLDRLGLPHQLTIKVTSKPRQKVVQNSVNDIIPSRPVPVAKEELTSIASTQSGELALTSASLPKVQHSSSLLQMPISGWILSLSLCWLVLLLLRKKKNETDEVS